MLSNRLLLKFLELSPELPFYVNSLSAVKTITGCINYSYNKLVKENPLLKIFEVK